MRLLAKIGLGIFLCLSIFMLTCAILRTAGMYHHGALDYPWQVFWHHSEACIGIIMGSLTAYRSALVGSNEVSDKIQWHFNRLFRRRNLGATPGHDAQEARKKSMSRQNNILLRIPGATLTGLRTLFGGSSRT